MSLDAGQFTVFAAVALGGIHGKRLLGHGSVLSRVEGYPLFFVQYSEQILVIYYSGQK
jgi:hypothetical protein